MVVVRCDEPGCTFGVCYVMPEPATPRLTYGGGHRVGAERHEAVTAIVADYDGDPRDGAAVMAWARSIEV